MITTRIVYDHRGRTKKGQAGPLEIRVTVDRKAYYVNTGIRVLRSEWKYDSVVGRPEAKELSERLTILLRKVEQEINKCIECGHVIDVAEIRRNINNTGASMDSHRTDFLDWCDEQIEKMDVVEGTKKHYRTLALRLLQFGVIKRWSDVTTENVLEFDAWLRNIGRTDDSLGRAISPAGIYTYHKCLKALLNRADAMGKIGRNPYDRLKGKIKRGDKENVEYLTEDEMKAVCNLRFEPGTILCKAKDLFVVQMYTGMALADVQKFNIDSFKKVDGRWVNRAERVKTGVAYITQLLPPVVEVLERYDMKVPVIDAADYNHALKLIGEAAGIKVKMHSHLARHTFATYMLRNGVKIENLQRMLGHNSIVTTQRYAKVLAMSVQEDFDMIAAKMKGSDNTQPKRAGNGDEIHPLVKEEISFTKVITGNVTQGR